MSMYLILVIKANLPIGLVSYLWIVQLVQCHPKVRTFTQLSLVQFHFNKNNSLQTIALLQATCTWDQTPFVLSESTQFLL